MDVQKPNTDHTRFTIAVVSLIGLGALLRFWGLSSGIPFAIQVDEPEIMERVVQMMKSGDLNPHFFDYPGLYFYLELAVSCGQFLLKATNGAWRSLNQVNTSNFYLWCRGLTAVLGTATVLLVYLAGRRWGKWQGLLAAGLMATQPMHVRESHFVLTDVPVTFFTALALVLALRALEQRSSGAFSWAGAAAGLAAATKYNGAIALLLPLLAAGLAQGTFLDRLKWCVLAVVSFLGAFVAGAPYTILDLPGFLNGYAQLAAYYRPPPSGAEPPWILYLKHLRGGLGYPGLLVAIAGLGMTLVRSVKGPDRERWILLGAFSLVYFWFIGNKGLVFGRYVLPLLPFTSLLIAAAVVAAVEFVRRFVSSPRVATALAALATLVVALQPAISAVQFDRTMSLKSTQALAYEFISRQIPPGSRILVEKYDIRLPPQLYRAEHVVRLTDRSYDDYVRSGFEYLIASSQVFGPAFDTPQNYPTVYAAYRQLFDQSTELATIKPSSQNPGPELRIYRLRKDGGTSGH